MDRLTNDVGSPSLSDYAARLRRRWWILVLTLILGVVVGAVLLSVTPKSYSSEASVLVTVVTPSADSANTANGRTQSLVNLDTESQLVTSAEVASRVQTILHTTTSVADLQSAVTVTVPPNSAVLTIDVTGSSALAAQKAAHAFAQAYLADRGDTAKQQLVATIAGLQTQLVQAQAQLKTVTDQSAALVAGSPDRANADAQRTVVSNQVTSLLAQIAPLQAAVPTPGQIISDATLPTSASSPLPALDIGGGIIAGLLLGLTLVVLLDARDHRLRRPADVARLVGLPLLADLPAEVTRRELPGQSHATVYDRLRNILMHVGADPAVVQVVDPGERGAGDMVAVQLARSISRVAGSAVLVLARAGSALPELTGTQSRPGLAEVLRGETTLAAASVRLPALDGISVLPAGRDLGDLERLLQSPRMAALLNELLASSNVVIETAGIAESAAAQAVAGYSNTVVLVAERGRLESRVVAADTEAAQAMGADVAGVVLVSAQGRRSTPKASSGAGHEPSFPLFEPAGDTYADAPSTGEASSASRPAYRSPVAGDESRR